MVFKFKGIKLIISQGRQRSKARVKNIIVWNHAYSWIVKLC